MQLEERFLPASAVSFARGRLRDRRLVVLAAVNAPRVKQHHDLLVTEKVLHRNAVVGTLGSVGDGGFCASPEATCARSAGPCPCEPVARLSLQGQGRGTAPELSL